ncbi:hypothetical protein [Sulfurimonas sp. NWX79]
MPILAVRLTTGVTPVYFDYITDRTMDVATNFEDDYNAHNAENDA